MIEALENSESLISLSPRRAGQMVFREVVSSSLKDLEYENGEVVRWRPKDHRLVVLDPDRAFGESILDRSAVSTSVISDELSVFGDERYIARAYDISLADVRAARRFEASLARR
ncbi:hypothetical protein [Jannaschia formosa]|uniref:hypothetical protein n=1 Tax=Jannaschia formosa TaxID=2259592 RepID=UPI000E1C0218|nr:hypothetical protein [Jannaschia formosa]TFL18874.1 hypothetical protein DR046_08115 [Jannaschia formosa]